MDLCLNLQVDEDEPVKDNVVNAHLNVGSTAVFLNPFTPSVRIYLLIVFVILLSCLFMFLL